jgi:glycosyltransferase involved in cell wall biosynthesis
VKSSKALKNNMPKVSIAIPSFNHEKYIQECLQSALKQTFQDFEIIITDDGSSDRSCQVIQKFTDPRIRLNRFIENKGACIAMNNCIRQASGEYIAVLNSDDAWEPAKLEKQVEYLDQHPESGAVFTGVTLVDEASNPLKHTQSQLSHIFKQKNRSRYAWLNYFFFRGNCLCHPSVMIRKSCYDKIGLYDERMASVPDLDMWVKLCLQYEIYIVEEKLLRFRIRADEANASGNHPDNQIRSRFELMQVLNNYLKIKDQRDFLRIFPESAKYGKVEAEYIPYFLSRMAMNLPHTCYHLWGLEILNNFMVDPLLAAGLDSKYHFRYLDLHVMTAREDVFQIRSLLTGTARYKVRSRNILLRLAIRTHGILAKIARKYILK